jgi:hypothetical protein
MAWFGNWFSKKSGATAGLASDAGRFDHAQAVKPASAGTHNAGERKGARLEQRELLYAVVRETMVRAGHITSGYKYKVLSLDSHGRQYLIMMDIKQDLQSQASALSKIELLLTQEALTRHNIQIAGVYWRCMEPKTPDAPKPLSADTSVKFAAAAATPVASAVATATPVKPAPADPAATKEALEKALSKPREKRNEVAPSAFPDTLLLDHDEHEFPLGATQLGGLN